MNIQDTVKAFSDLYRTIDVRVVAFLKDEVWTASHVVIRLRLESTQDVKNQQNTILNKFQTISNDNFKIFFSAIGFDEWEIIKQNWKENKIVLEDNTIHIKTEDIFHYGIDAPRSHDNTDYVNKNLNSYNVHKSLNLPHVSIKLREMGNDAISVGCPNMQDYLSKILETSTYQIDSGFYILTVPIFFKIEDIIFDKNHLEIKCYGPNEKVTGSFSIYELQRGQGTRGQAKLQESFQNFDLQNLGTWAFILKHNFSLIEPDDEFEIVFTRNNVIIERKSGLIRWHWPSLSSVINPIFSIFEKFISQDELKNALLEPQKKKISNIGTFGPDKIFERSVNWLLNLLGISSINLQEYDQSGEGVNRITLDVVGKFEDTIILCHPTIATNLEGVLDTAKNVKDYFKKELADDFILKSVVFTPKSVVNQRNSVADDDVILLGKEQLEFILNELERGNIDQARNLVLGTTDSL